MENEKEEILKELENEDNPVDGIINLFKQIGNSIIPLSMRRKMKLEKLQEMYNGLPEDSYKRKQLESKIFMQKLKAEPKIFYEGKKPYRKPKESKIGAEISEQ